MGGASNRRRGHDYEREVAAYLRSVGLDAVTTRSLAGGRQEGRDVACSALPVALEAKRAASYSLGPWLDQASRQAADQPGAVVVDRRGKNVRESFVVMRLADFVDLVRTDRS